MYQTTCTAYFVSFLCPAPTCNSQESVHSYSAPHNPSHILPDTIRNSKCFEIIERQRNSLLCTVICRHVIFVIGNSIAFRRFISPYVHSFYSFYQCTTVAYFSLVDKHPVCPITPPFTWSCNCLQERDKMQKVRKYSHLKI